MTTYPVITADKLLPFQKVEQLLKADPECLEDPRCPYAREVKVFLKRHFALGEGVSGAGGGEGVEVTDVLGEDLKNPETWDDIVTKSRQLYARLEQLTITGGLEAGETIQITKAQAGLLERLVDLGEKASGVKKSSAFIRDVLNIFEEVLDEERRAEVMTRLEEYL